MNWWDRAKIGAQLGRAALAWLRRDTRYPSPLPENPGFRSPYDAAGLIADGSVVAVSGMGAHQHASILYAAIRKRFEETGHPAGLTVINVGGHGGRGLAPGTLEELGRPGLCTRFITSHFETFHALLALAEAGRCELQCIPFGVLTRLFEALGRGEDSVLSPVGVGTFLDPRVGRGSPLEPGGEQLVTLHGDLLRYRIPSIDVAIFNAPAADREGNLYVKGCAVIGESLELARAARHSHGTVIANVGLIVEAGYDPIFLPADGTDAVVYHPDTEQTVGVFHRAHWPMFTTDSDVPVGEGLARLRFINSLVPALAHRTAADLVLARLAAATLVANVDPGALVSIGTGLPEEVAPAVFEAGLLGDLTFAVESGVVGGVPAPGVYFGASLCPEQIVSSARVFERCHEGLDATCLGALEVDGQGNVNVSRRGAGPRHYVGPGGFIDFCTAARTIVFVSAWMLRGEIAVEDARLRVVKPGAPKFVDRVSEISFDGARALAAGKRVFYVTHVGVFRLTVQGLELICVTPGIDVRRDILDFAPIEIQLPPGGRVPRVPRSIVTGKSLAWGRLSSDRSSSSSKSSSSKSSRSG
jgi:propionate CoA-transferase